jgi:hypothetical protein
VKFGRLFIQPPLFRLVHQLLRVLWFYMAQSGWYHHREACIMAASIDHENVIGDYALLMLHCAEEFMWEKEHILVRVLWFY